MGNKESNAIKETKLFVSMVIFDHIFSRLGVDFFLSNTVDFFVFLRTTTYIRYVTILR
jgi:hypothetical protein